MTDTGGAVDAIASGSIVVNNYVKRNVRVLAVHEHEVDQIAFFNSLSTVCFSIASALFFFAVGIWVNAAFQEEITPAGDILATVVARGGILLSIVALIVGVVTMRKRQSLLEVIKVQSETVTTDEGMLQTNGGPAA